MSEQKNDPVSKLMGTIILICASSFVIALALYGALWAWRLFFRLLMER